MRVSGNRRPRGGRSTSGGGRSGQSGGRSGSNNNRRSNTGNRSYDSNGPDGKIRGSASQVYDKYVSLARDSQTSGDPVAAENYFQHAEHYFRIMLANNLVKQERAAEQSSDEGNNKPEANEAPVDATVVLGDEESGQDGKKASDQDSSDANSNEEAPIVIDLSNPENADDAETASPEASSEEGEKPKSKRRVSRTRGLRRRTSSRNEENSEKEEPQTTD